MIALMAPELSGSKCINRRVCSGSLVQDFVCCCLFAWDGGWGLFTSLAWQLRSSYPIPFGEGGLWKCLSAVSSNPDFSANALTESPELL